jgi:hypothetical protein
VSFLENGVFAVVNEKMGADSPGSPPLSSFRSIQSLLLLLRQLGRKASDLIPVAGLLSLRVSGFWLGETGRTILKGRFDDRVEFV